MTEWSKDICLFWQMICDNQRVQTLQAEVVADDSAETEEDDEDEESA